MENPSEKKWSKDEFKAYILIYAAMANYVESPEEKEFILSKVSEETYEKMHKEIDKDNDFESIQKIRKGYENCGYTDKNLEVLLKEIKNLLYSDNRFDEMERNLLLWLNKILRD